MPSPDSDPAVPDAIDAEVRANIAVIEHRLTDACTRANRARANVTLIAVSKMRGPDVIRAASAAGVTHVGENYLQEAEEKQDALADLPLSWHFIGPIQSNKTRAIAARFDVVHSVDRERIARRLSDQRPRDRGPLPVFLQVNIDDEPSKTGVDADGFPALVDAALGLPGIAVAGIMVIPRPGDLQRTREAFERTAMLAAQLPPGRRGLSMGMSADVELAIECGATHVRIGTALFGPRPPRVPDASESIRGH